MRNVPTTFDPNNPVMVNPVYEVDDLTTPPANPPPSWKLNLLVYVVSTVLNGLYMSCVMCDASVPFSPTYAVNQYAVPF